MRVPVVFSEGDVRLVGGDRTQSPLVGTIGRTQVAACQHRRQIGGDVIEERRQVLMGRDVSGATPAVLVPLIGRVVDRGDGFALGEEGGNGLLHTAADDDYISSSWS